MPLTRTALEKLYNGRPIEEVRESSSSMVFEQYKLYVEMADRISNRRLTTNSFFLALNSAIVSLGGYTVVKGGPVPLGLIWLTGVAGVLISMLWLRIITSHRDLNTAKFEVIHAIEKLLPLGPYDAEWEAVGRGRIGWLYTPFTHIEVWVPVGFMVLHSTAALILALARTP